MSWDRKRRGAGTGYYYRSVRVPGKPHPIKVYLGRGTAAHEAAAAVEADRQGRLAAASTIRTECAATAEADRLTDELIVRADLLSALWLALTGHEYRRGEWRN